MNLTLTGGEPLAHPDFLALGARARELGFVVRVKSNGHALRGELARRLRDEIDPFLIEVSLHGATAATHDRQTRVPGSFDRLLANLRELRELGLRVKLNSTLTAWNEGEIAGMFALADALRPAAPGRSGSDAARRRRPRAAAGDRQPRGGAPALPPAVRARARGGRGEPGGGPGGARRRRRHPAARRPTSTAAPAPRGWRSTPTATSTPACSGAGRWATSTGRGCARSGSARPVSPRCATWRWRSRSGSPPRARAAICSTSAPARPLSRPAPPSISTPRRCSAGSFWSR